MIELDDDGPRTLRCIIQLRNSLLDQIDATELCIQGAFEKIEIEKMTLFVHLIAHTPDSEQ